ncbi:hypothetical protein CY35_04G103000 [Sphagnum magellanicum]|nr:hypothetical protein CY35_04G103000 [Sphagnum magellanicum]
MEIRYKRVNKGEEDTTHQTLSILIRRSTSIISNCILLCNGDHDFGKHHLFHL